MAKSVKSPHVGMKTLASTKPTRGGHKLAVQRDGHVVTAPARRGLLLRHGERAERRAILKKSNGGFLAVMEILMKWKAKAFFHC